MGAYFLCQWGECSSVAERLCARACNCSYVRYADRGSAEKAKLTLDGCVMNGEVVQVMRLFADCVL